jgi:hypothetical protein
VKSKMSRPLKFALWTLPLLGLAVGYIYAHMVYTGLLVTWHPIGQPGEAIVQILGFRDPNKFLVSTGTGEVYSFEYPYLEKRALPPKISWETEQDLTVDDLPQIQYDVADFATLAPPFQAVQLFEMEYIYHIEGKGELKLALAPDGNLWLWDHKISGLFGLVYFFYPAIGFLIGLTVVVLIYGIIWMKSRQNAVGEQTP